jgi:molybdate transport system ATP-binding protein
MAEAASLSLAVEQRLPGGFTIAAAIDVALGPGAVLVLFGPSGAGKTTILRQIAGLARPDTGTIRFAGDVWCDTAAGIWMPPQVRRVGLVFQDPTLFPHLTVRGNICYGIRSPRSRSDLGLTLDQTGLGIEEIETMLGIGDLKNRYPRALSGGEAQRVALARALAPAPRLLLLDEPFAALDAPARLRLRRELTALLQTTGTPAILVTHDRSEALAMGDIMAVVIAGRTRQAGPVADLFSRPADADIAASLGIDAVIPARVAAASGGVVEVSIGDILLHVAEREPIAPGTFVYACLRAEDVTLEARAPGQASARNHLAARVISIASEGPIDRVTLDCGFALDALITRRSREEMRLAPGAQVTAAIKATSVHLIPRL